MKYYFYWYYLYYYYNHLNYLNQIIHLTLWFNIFINKYKYEYMGKMGNGVINE